VAVLEAVVSAASAVSAAAAGLAVAGFAPVADFEMSDVYEYFSCT